MIDKAPRHIAFFLPALNSGGAEKAFIMLAAHFADQGIKVDILVAKAQGAYLSYVPATLTLIELGGGTIERAVWPLIRYIKTHKPDYIISGLPGPNVMALLAKKLTGASRTRFIITQHHPFSLNAATSKKWRTKLRTALAKLLFKDADHIVAVSNGVAHDLAPIIKVPLSRITTIYNPLNLQAMSNRAQTAPDHPWLTNKTTPVLIAAGRLAPPKDYDTILRALSLTPKPRLL